MSSESETNESGESDGIINVTRRQALKMGVATAAANAAVTKPNIKKALAQQIDNKPIGNIHFQIQASPTGGYGQFENPDTGQYIVYGGSDIMTLSQFDANIDDDTLTAYIYISMNGSQFHEIGSVSTSMSNYSGADNTWEVSAEDLWGDNTDAWVADDGGADLMELTKDTNLAFNDYNDIALDTVPTDVSDPMKVENTITVKYVFQTGSLEINEQSEKTFDIVTTVVLGFGKSFGKNFGMKDIDHGSESFIEARVDPS